MGSSRIHTALSSNTSVLCKTSICKKTAGTFARARKATDSLFLCNPYQCLYVLQFPIDTDTFSLQTTFSDRKAVTSLTKYQFFFIRLLSLTILHFSSQRNSPKNDALRKYQYAFGSKWSICVLSSLPSFIACNKVATNKRNTINHVLETRLTFCICFFLFL